MRIGSFFSRTCAGLGLLGGGMIYVINYLQSKYSPYGKIHRYGTAVINKDNVKKIFIGYVPGSKVDFETKRIDMSKLTSKKATAQQEAKELSDEPQVGFVVADTENGENPEVESAEDVNYETEIGLVASIRRMVEQKLAELKKN